MSAVRFVFPETADGRAAFHAWSWPTLAAESAPTDDPEVGTVASLAEVEQFIESQIG